MTVRILHRVTNDEELVFVDALIPIRIEHVESDFEPRLRF